MLLRELLLQLFAVLDHLEGSLRQHHQLVHVKVVVVNRQRILPIVLKLVVQMLVVILRGEVIVLIDSCPDFLQGDVVVLFLALHDSIFEILQGL